MNKERYTDLDEIAASRLVVGGVIIGSWLGWLACAGWTLNPKAGTVALVAFVLFIIYRESKRPRYGK